MLNTCTKRCLANYENANKNLDKARQRNRDVPQAETAQQEACARFEQVSEGLVAFDAF